MATARVGINPFIVNLFNVDINITIKIIYKKKEKKNISLHKNKANRCQLKNKTVKNIFYEKLFSMKITNIISFLPVSEKTNKKTNENARVIAGLSITGDNEIRLLTFMFNK